MNKKFKILLATLLSAALFALAVVYIMNTDIAILDTAGWVAMKERQLLIHASWLMLIIVLPVFVIAFAFAWKYRAENVKEPHDSRWDSNPIFELFWWGFPFVIVIALSIITYKGCHELDPFRPLDHETKPIRIQAVALDWKWLFIYPDQKIATVNYLQFPEKTPLNFEITADAPMNAFWIPKLGSQVYAMAGMRSKLHLIADGIGEYRGSSANLSGAGFSGMWFKAVSCSQQDFETWVSSARQSGNQLNLKEYTTLLAPSERNPVTYYTLEKENLFDYIIMKYMMPEHELHKTHPEDAHGSQHH